MSSPLLAGLIDYAGLFPPARLPMGPAWANYVDYRGGPDAWLLGRFICPAARLQELAPLLAATPHDQGPWPISILGRGGNDQQEYFAHVRADLADLNAFAQQFGARVAMEVYETKLPASAFQPVAQNQIAALVATTGFLMERDGAGALGLFLEAPAMNETCVPPLLEALQEYHQRCAADQRPRRERCGLKIRCGGLEAAAFPAPELLAKVLRGAALLRVPLKATAGLHHPFRHLDPGVNVVMHGFVNLLAAACACWLGETQLGVVQQILEDPEPKNFSLLEETLSWKGQTWPAEWVRREFFTSLGSCSFDEPRQDLRAAGWL